MKVFITLCCVISALATLLVFSPSDGTGPEEISPEKQTSNAPGKHDGLPSSIIRTTIPQVVSKEPPPDFLKDFAKDLALLYGSPDGRDFRYRNQRDKVEELLAEGKKTPVDDISRMLRNAGSIISVESLVPFQVLGLSEMEFVKNRFASQTNSLKFLAATREDASKLPQDRAQQAAVALQAKIRASPMGYPPETIFFAFSEGDNFPSDDQYFIQSLSRSRDEGILLASSHWMEYTAWTHSANWQNSFPEYADFPLSSEQLSSIPQINEVYLLYLQAEQVYLSSILSDMANYGYLK